MQLIAYRLLRWVAPKLPPRLADLAWMFKWRLWHDLYGPHICLWQGED